MSQSHIQLEYSRCPLDCPANDEFILKGYDRLHGLPGQFSVVRCRKCGLMRTNPRPTQDTINLYYPNNYGPYLGTKFEENIGKQYVRWPRLKRLIRQICQFNTKILPDLPPGRMLEFGCASGSFMHLMAKQGWDVEGVEFSEIAAQNAISLGYPVHIGPLESAPKPSLHYDLIVGWMVLEHLHEPVLALRKLREWTHPGGWLAVTVPNCGSLEFSLFKDAWYALQLPCHLYHYTPKTIRLILQKAGWHMEQVFHQRILSNFVASCGYVFQDWGIAGRLAKSMTKFPESAWRLHYALYPLAYLLGFFGQTGRMTVWARKIDD